MPFSTLARRCQPQTRPLFATWSLQSRSFSAVFLCFLLWEQRESPQLPTRQELGEPRRSKQCDFVPPALGVVLYLVLVYSVTMGSLEVAPLDRVLMRLGMTDENDLEKVNH